MSLTNYCLVRLPDWLIKIDRQLFAFINAEASSPYLDWLMMAMRHAATWIPLYAFMFYWIVRFHKQYAWQFIFLSLVTFAITDYTSASILKPWFARLRPCYDPALEDIVRSLVGCAGRFGLPSTHASNHFGLAAFWFLSIYWMAGRRWYWLWIWAFAIGYAQVYVGKHYPFDILLGSLLGIAAGSLTAFLFRRWLLRPKTVNSNSMN